MALLLGDAQAWHTRENRLRFLLVACVGLGHLEEKLRVDLNNNKGVQGGRQVSSLKMPPGVLLF